MNKDSRSVQRRRRRRTIHADSELSPDVKALLDRERTVVTVPAATRARVLARAMACVASGPPLQRREDESLAERRSILSLFFKKV